MTDLICCGKRFDNRVWVEGYAYFPTNETGLAMILKGTMNKRDNYVVFRDTVRRYTGIDDVHGRKVFESSIIEYSHIRARDTKWVGKVIFYRGAFMAESKDSMGDTHAYPLHDLTAIKVLGNVFDNPKLLED